MGRRVSILASFLILTASTAWVVRAQFGGPPTQLGGPGSRGQGQGFPQPAAPNFAPTPTDQTPAPLRTETVFVPVRAVVWDTQGHAVSHLTKDDFKVYQDGKQQEITTFTEFSSVAPAPSAGPASAAVPSGMPGTRTAATDTAQPSAGPALPGRFITLFFDDVHLYFAPIVQTRTAAEKYLSSLRPEDRVAIVTSSGQGELGFTGDRDKLREALGKLQPRPFVGGSMNPGDFGCPPPMTYTEADAIVRADSTAVLAIAGGDVVDCKESGQMEDPRATAQAAQGIARAAAGETAIAGSRAIEAVFGQLRATVRRMSALPGQRVIVMVSPGFVFSGHQSDFKDITDLAVRSNVVINTLDAMGIPIDGKWDPDRFRAEGFGHDSEYAVLSDLADGTGGQFVRFNNDFAGAITQMAQPPEAYYLLGYVPQNLAADGKYHILRVTLTHRSRDTVQARHGFYAPSSSETPAERAKRELDDAIFSEEDQHGLPIAFQSQLEAGDAGGQKLVVKASVDVSRLDFQRTSGKNQESFVVAAVLFDADGNYVEGTRRDIQMDLQDTTLSELKKTGVYVEIDLDVKPGSYVLRTVAGDASGLRISAASSPLAVPD